LASSKGADGPIGISPDSMMAEIFSLAKIRRRKSAGRSKRSPSKRCPGRSSPDSYVILLDEPDQAIVNPIKQNQIPQHLIPRQPLTIPLR